MLAIVGEPIQVKATALDGGTTPLTSFAVALAVAVSLMFITLLLGRRHARARARGERLLAPGPRARLAHGPARREGGPGRGLLGAVCLLMLAGLGLFVELDWGRFPLWVAALAVGALAFAALGLAIGALTREVRAASLLAFMLCLPLAFLALVPSGAVSPALYDVIRAVSAVFPFKPRSTRSTPRSTTPATSAGRCCTWPALTLGFGALGRLALSRFA